MTRTRRHYIAEHELHVEGVSISGGWSRGHTFARLSTHCSTEESRHPFLAVLQCAYLVVGIVVHVYNLGQLSVGLSDVGEAMYGLKKWIEL